MSFLDPKPLTPAGLDTATAAKINTPGSAVATALAATYVSGKGGNVARFIKRAQAKETLKIVALGDSVLEGQTVTNPATEGTIKLLANDLSARFGTTITETNYAVSGYTSAASFINGKVRDAINAAGDLYILAYGKNDRGWATAAPTAWPVPGYDTTSSIATLEQMVRLIRADVPKADIILMAENPYTPLVTQANTDLQAYNQQMRRVAAAYGCEFVDAYQPFADQPGNITALVPDGTHPGTVGHRLMADAVLQSIPALYAGPALNPGKPEAGRTMAGAQKTDTTTNLRGWTTSATTGGTGSGTWTNSGAGWTGPGPYVTSTAGNYAEFVITGTELLLTISTLAADNAVVDVTVDGAALYTARNLTQGKQGSAYLVPFVTGLSAGLHTIRVTLVSGTLKIHQASWTEAGTGFVPDVVVVDLGSFAGEAALDSATGATTYLINNASAIPLPTGWSKMDVVITGYVLTAVKAATTTERLVNINLRLDLVAKQVLQNTVPAVASGEFVQTFNIGHAERGKTAAVGVRFEARMQGTDKTNGFHRSWGLQATCYRRA
jgi:lysophospholipase L1-like esterase